MIIRHPNPGDTETILRLARAMHAESWYRDLDFDEGAVLRLLDACQTNDDLVAFLAVDPAHGVVGFFCGAVTQHFFGRDRYACDLALYVAPEFRNGFAARRMIAAYEAWCRIKRVSEIHIGVSTGMNEERIARFYQKLGYGSPVIGLRKKCVWPD